MISSGKFLSWNTVTILHVAHGMITICTDFMHALKNVFQNARPERKIRSRGCPCRRHHSGVLDCAIARRRSGKATDHPLNTSV
jgi:hypothetical protein